MPLAKYKLHKKSFEDSVNFNLSSTIVIEPAPTVTSSVSENNHKRQRIESVEETVPVKSTITVTPPVEKVEEQPRKKRTKTKTVQDEVIQPTVPEPIPEPPVIEPMVVEQPIIEKETISEPPVSLPSTNARIRELKSKTPAWKAQPPAPRGNPQGNKYNYICRFILAYSR